MMRNCVMLVFVLCLLVGCGGEPAPVEGDTPLPPVETSTPMLPTETPASTGNGRIAFKSDRDGNWEIYVMNADGSGQTRLTDNPAEDGGADWSPCQLRCPHEIQG